MWWKFFDGLFLIFWISGHYSEHIWIQYLITTSWVKWDHQGAPLLEWDEAFIRRHQIQIFLWIAKSLKYLQATRIIPVVDTLRISVCDCKYRRKTALDDLSHPPKLLLPISDIRISINLIDAALELQFHLLIQYVDTFTWIAIWSAPDRFTHDD